TGCGGGSTGGTTAKTAAQTETPPPPPPPAPAAQKTAVLSTCAPATHTAATPYTYTTSTALHPAAITTDYGYLTVDIPVESVGIGIVLAGTNVNYKFIEHGIIFDLSTDCMTGPAGNVPFSFNHRDWSGDGLIDDDPGSLVNYQAPALFFPNDGQQWVLPAGTYTFPVGSLNMALTATESDTLTPTVYYMTPSAVVPTLKVNLWLVEGVKAGISSDAGVAADREIFGATTYLKDIFQNNANIAVNVAVTARYIAATGYAVLDTFSEIDTLVKSYPAAPTPDDAVNIFVVDSMGDQTSASPIIPAGYIGLALGLPGPFLQEGTVVSGVLAEYQHDGNGTTLGSIITHELGHYLGLYHTTQTNEKQTGFIGYDPIADTAVCSTTPLSTCADKDNLMFPVEMGISPLKVTVEQGRVLRLNPVMK
ncbi:MAG: hypothetical protein OEW39_08535, partial [Deltaproteobacteria bacterium]|nr:hypothetical protein [Deltaproteobacteria bacterium]